MRVEYDNQGMQISMDPKFQPLAARLGQEFNSWGQGRGGYGNVIQAVGVRIVDDIPAPALCRFDRNEIFVQSKYMHRMDPDEVGTPRWYLTYAKVIGIMVHEYCHWLQSNHDFDKWAKFYVKTDPRMPRAQIAIEEPRIEAAEWEHLSELRQAALIESLDDVVLRSFDGATADGLNEQLIEQLVWLVAARGHISRYGFAGETLDTYYPRIASVTKDLEVLFGNHWKNVTQMFRDLPAMESHEVNTFAWRWLQILDEVVKDMPEPEPIEKEKNEEGEKEDGEQEPGDKGKGDDKGEDKGEDGDSQSESDKGDKGGDEPGDEPGDKSDKPSDKGKPGGGDKADKPDDKAKRDAVRRLTDAANKMTDDKQKVDSTPPKGGRAMQETTRRVASRRFELDRDRRSQRMEYLNRWR